MRLFGDGPSEKSEKALEKQKKNILRLFGEGPSEKSQKPWKNQQKNQKNKKKKKTIFWDSCLTSSISKTSGKLVFCFLFFFVFFDFFGFLKVFWGMHFSATENFVCDASFNLAVRAFVHNVVVKPFQRQFTTKLHIFYFIHSFRLFASHCLLQLQPFLQTSFSTLHTSNSSQYLANLTKVLKHETLHPNGTFYSNTQRNFDK